jgi:hypothetical protein
MDWNQIAIYAVIGGVVGALAHLFGKLKKGKPAAAEGEEAELNPEAQETVKRSQRKARITLLVVIGAFIALAVVMSVMPAREKTFSKAGLSITLTAAFNEKSVVAYTGYYESRTSAVATLKEEFSNLRSMGIYEDTSLREYAQLVQRANQTRASIEERDGIIYFEYERAVAGKEFTYLATVFKSEDAFWLVQFFSETKDYNKHRDDFFKWAGSVSFDGSAA